MIEILKEIPKFTYELYEEMTFENCTSALKKTIYHLGIAILKASVLIAVAQFHPYLLGISFFVGIALPDMSMQITSVAFAAIFQTKDLVPPDNLSAQKRIYQIWFKIKNQINYLRPIIGTGIVCFFGLPVFTGSVFAVFSGLRFGANCGKLADLTKFNLQPLYTK